MMDTLTNLLGRNEKSAEFESFRTLAHADFTRTVMQSAGRVFHSAHACGVLVGCNLEGDIQSIFVHLRPRPPYSAYQGDLVPEWLVGAARPEIQKRLGSVEATGAAPRKTNDRKELPWDRFKVGNALVHLEYDDDDKVSLVTLTHSRQGGTGS